MCNFYWHFCLGLNQRIQIHTDSIYVFRVLFDPSGRSCCSLGLLTSLTGQMLIQLRQEAKETR